MINYHDILQMGIQSLVSMFGGWACAKWAVLEPEPTVEHLNRFVLRVCIPCLQVWLLAVKTDMRVTSNWGILLAFLMWSICMQLLALAKAGRWRSAAAMLLPSRGSAPHLPSQAARSSTLQQHLDLSAWATHGLVLSTNNTGILGPVVLQAALGPKYAPLGMLATVVLYFQQLPTAALLYEVDALLQQQQQGKCRTPEPDLEQYQRQHQHTTATALQPSAAPHHQPRPGRLVQAHTAAAAASGSAAGAGGRAAAAGADPAGGCDRVAGPGCARTKLREVAAALLLRNPLVWSTGAALAASCLGSHALLDPASPAALPALAWLDRALAWFAGVTAPVTLFTTGMWMAAHPTAGGHWRQEVLSYLLLRGTAGPATMVLLARLLGFRGEAASALVILSLLPVAQTAFVVAQQYQQAGAAAVSSAMLASLLLMLPQLLGVLALLQWSGLLA